MRNIYRPHFSQGREKNRPETGTTSSRLLGLSHQALLCQVLYNLAHTLFDAQQVGSDGDLRGFGGLVGGRDTREILDLARPRLFIQPLGVALLGLLEGNVDKDLDERQGVVAWLGGTRM